MTFNPEFPWWVWALFWGGAFLIVATPVLLFVLLLQLGARP